MQLSSSSYRSAAPYVPALHAVGAVEPAAHHEPRGHGREHAALLSPSSSPTTPAGHSYSTPATQYAPILHGTARPATHVTPSPHGRSDVRVDVSSASSGAPSSVASVNVSLPAPTVRGEPSPPGQKSDGPPHADGADAPAVA